jgi:NADH-quinone oxidoreductase subunit N
MDPLRAFAPELAIAAGLVGAVIALLISRRDGPVTLIGILACGLGLLLAVEAPSHVTTGGLLVADHLLWMARLGILGATAICLAAGRGQSAGERQLMILGLGGGALVLAGAGNLVTLALGVEATSITAWLLAGWRVNDRTAAEAGLKYALFGALASGVMLFGISHCYGIAGGLSFADLGAAPASAALGGALLLTGAGLAYKLALPPFHLYAPDVYQGAPASAVAAFSTIPKIAALAVVVRLLMALGTTATATAGPVLAVVGIAAIAVGGFLALAQRDARRILAFSAVVHIGSLLLALVAWPSPSGIGALSFYVAAYVLLGLGSFLTLGAIEVPGAGVLRIRGAWRRAPFAVVCLALLMAGLAGIPPLPGFFAKWLVLREAIGHGGGWGVAAAVAILAGTALTIAAYLRILRETVIEDGVETAPGTMRWAGPCTLAAVLLPIALVRWPLG